MTEQEYNTVLSLSITKPIPKALIPLVQRFAAHSQKRFMVSMLRKWLDVSQGSYSH